MLWGIDRDAWIQLWAGLLGAVPAAVLSAVVAALVAVTVLGRTNKHQQMLAATAAAEQQRLTEVQLEQQKRLSDLQLVEQRAEAALVRERAAIADAISSAADLASASRESMEAISQALTIFRSAVTRWRLELGPSTLSMELSAWDSLLSDCASNHWGEYEKGRWGDEERKACALKLLNESVDTLSHHALAWQFADDDDRDLLVRDIVRKREETTAALELMASKKFPPLDD